MWNRILFSIASLVVFPFSAIESCLTLKVKESLPDYSYISEEDKLDYTGTAIFEKDPSKLFVYSMNMFSWYYDDSYENAIVTKSVFLHNPNEEIDYATFIENQMWDRVRNQVNITLETEPNALAHEEIFNYKNAEYYWDWTFAIDSYTGDNTQSSYFNEIEMTHTYTKITTEEFIDEIWKTGDTASETNNLTDDANANNLAFIVYPTEKNFYKGWNATDVIGYYPPDISTINWFENTEMFKVSSTGSVVPSYERLSVQNKINNSLNATNYQLAFSSEIEKYLEDSVVKYIAEYISKNNNDLSFISENQIMYSFKPYNKYYYPQLELENNYNSIYASPATLKRAGGTSDFVGESCNFEFKFYNTFGKEINIGDEIPGGVIYMEINLSKSGEYVFRLEDPILIKVKIPLDEEVGTLTPSIDIIEKPVEKIPLTAKEIFIGILISIFAIIFTIILIYIIILLFRRENEK